MFDWQDLHFFNVLAQHGSLSATARELGVDHATVGRRIASLETALGLRLIDRLPRSCPLTEDGVAVAELTRQMEADAQAVLRRARGSASLLAATVRVSAPPALATFCIAPCVGELRRAHPNLKLVLQGSSSIAALDRGEADIAVRLSNIMDRRETPTAAAVLAADTPAMALPARRLVAHGIKMMRGGYRLLLHYPIKSGDGRPG
ncbi:LysR family transcriptional regulator [Bradyrhizobium sp. NAS80.1]|uniref:LysR family transcriptional regulator n=1 Tax=Bradyrhizobium sp. NAS80.1 TaxID=1680159 RepID=UPI0009FF5737|nr:LysR family transcriptional regulator [Bradyrhizobium sp. NAS80.1]